MKKCNISPLPCPFCGAQLVKVLDSEWDECAGVWMYGWAEHPEVLDDEGRPVCMFSGWEFDAFDVAQWNRRDG